MFENGSLPQFGGGSMYPGGPMSMGDGSGMGMFGQDPKKKKKSGFNPLMMLSPFAALMSQDPKMGLAMMSPGIGIANLLGAFK